MNNDSGAVPAARPLVIDASNRGHDRHHHHHHPSGGGESGGGGKASHSHIPFCGADAKVACIALAVAASASLAIAAANVFLFVRRARLMKRGENLEPASPRRAGSGGERLLLSSPSTARGAVQGTLAAAVAVALAVSHLVSSSSPSLATSPDAKFYHLCLAATWATAAALCGVAASCRRAPRIRPVAWLSPLLYLVEAAVVLASSGSSSPSSRRVALYSPLARLAVALVLAVSQAKRGLSAVDLEEDALVTRALLAGPPGRGSSSLSPSRRDVEAPAGPFSASKSPSRGWISLLGVAIAFVWPEDPAHQARAAACVVLLVLSRVANLAVPASYAYLVNRLAAADAAAHPPAGSGQPPMPTPLRSLLVPAVVAYLAALYLQGGSGGGSMGLLNNARQYAWIPISQAAARKINVDAFAHVLGMDLRYHLMRKTGELTRVLDRGSSAIQNLLSTVLFQVGPQLFDIAAAAVYVAAALEPWVAAIMFVTLASYIPLTIYLTERRGKYRKELNVADNVRSARATDALISWETVKYFCAEDREVARLANSIDEYQVIEMKLLGSLNSLNVIQSTVIFAGTASGLYVCSVGVANGSLRVGDAVLFLSLMAQLAIPLNWFGTFYRTIQQQCIDADGMFNLLAQLPTVIDASDAIDLPPGGDGSIEFKKVTFSWDRVVPVPRGVNPASVPPSSSSASSPVLKDVSLKAPGGTSLAIVGPTGSGKSTLLRLAFRFVDPDSGSVLIEGRDARTLKQHSMRSIMSVTPQESVLFNDTIEYNLRYANPSATREQVEAAARVAAIHDTIIGFPRGYQTVVGERGLRLSGGEKQRVALARAVLRKAKIMLLDESTSALDALTEAAVQRALRGALGSAAESAGDGGNGGDQGGERGGGAGRNKPLTMLVVAHRLSTVMHCDSIAVMKEGRVVEVGTHSELVSMGGLYASMWARQSSSSAALVEEEEEKVQEGDGEKKMD